MSEIQVQVTSSAYVPATVTIPANFSVVWTWALGAGPSSVTCGADNFDSGLLSHQSSYRHGFRAPGIYSYQSSNNSSMLGAVIVI
jgi:plastocyanin